MNDLTNIIIIIVFILIIVSVCLYIYVKSKLEQIKVIRKKSKIEEFDEELARLKSED